MVIVTDKSEADVRQECESSHPGQIVGLVDVDEDDFEEEEY
jgi:hypothetical protein